MPKQTAKYVAACSTLRKIKQSTAGDQEAAYKRLQDAGFMWNSKSQIWMSLGNEPADKPTKLIYCRVWAAADVVAEVADLVEDAMKARAVMLIERSNPYPCRPPKQLESRIYLKFIQPGVDR